MLTVRPLVVPAFDMYYPVGVRGSVRSSEARQAHPGDHPQTTLPQTPGHHR